MKIIRKGGEVQISEHLNQREFDCKCKKGTCLQTPISDALVETFEKFRAIIGCPIQLTSGYRCIDRNNNTIGANPKSQHLTGHAMDIYVSGEMKKKFKDKDAFTEIEKLLKECGAVYAYSRPLRNYLHFDVRGKD